MAKKADQKVLEKIKEGLMSLKDKPFSLQDAALKTGFSLNELKSSLNHLIFEYRGTFLATDQGELLYSFPNGFSKPWEVNEKFTAFFEKAKKGFLGVLKFITRAWISIVMVAYVVIFALILIALSFAKSSDKDEDSSPSLSSQLMFHTLLRLILDSLFWTFHPFSPFRVDYYQDDYYYEKKPKVPFYQKVNNFFFGPEEVIETDEEKKAKILQEIRAKKGRVGIFDVMRILGFSKQKADPFMAKMLAEYDGDIELSENGQIYYEFPSIRKTALNEVNVPQKAIWQERLVLKPFTGNSFGDNFLIIALNSFNLFMSTFAISANLTIEKLSFMFSKHQGIAHFPLDSTPLLLGWIPFLFSLFLFSIPVTRAFLRPKERKKVERENGFRGIIKTIFSKLRQGGIKEEELKKGYQELAQVVPSDKELSREVIKLGGDIEVKEDGQIVYRFKDLEREIIAVLKAQMKADEKEVKVGQVVFSSKD